MRLLDAPRAETTDGRASSSSSSDPSLISITASAAKLKIETAEASTADIPRSLHDIPANTIATM